jgi:hypothetical protein
MGLAPTRAAKDLVAEPVGVVAGGDQQGGGGVGADSGSGDQLGCQVGGDGPHPGGDRRLLILEELDALGEPT